ncbi:MAG: hypothetical protein LBU06_04295 [Desulfovibrio sp.]|jgi:hypothetical protein|nr:hypothetical protein [Desulfovibrio sp.]
MNFDSFIAAVIGSVSVAGLLGVCGFIFRGWVVEKLKASINYEYNLKLIELQREREIRLRGEVVAELMAQWIRKDERLDYYTLQAPGFAGGT